MLRAATQGILGEIAPITGVVRHSKFSATTAAMGHSRRRWSAQIVCACPECSETGHATLQRALPLMLMRAVGLEPTFLWGIVLDLRVYRFRHARARLSEDRDIFSTRY